MIDLEKVWIFTLGRQQQKCLLFARIINVEQVHPRSTRGVEHEVSTASSTEAEAVIARNNSIVSHWLE